MRQYVIQFVLDAPLGELARRRIKLSQGQPRTIRRCFDGSEAMGEQTECLAQIDPRSMRIVY
mgnify:CR=1